MISIQDVEELHKTLIDKFGGSHGLRDKSTLASALARPFQTFDNKDLYRTVLEKLHLLLRVF